MIQLVDKLELPFFYGDRCLIIGGGPSIADMDWDEIRAFDGRTIAINEAGLTVDPNADIFYWCDWQWGQWNRDRYHLNKSPHRLTSAQGNIGEFGGTNYIHTENSVPFHTTGVQIAGRDSGTRCINLAYLCGIRQVYLIGFDMHDTPGRKGNFHDHHQQIPPGKTRSAYFVPAHTEMSKHLPNDFQVFNCTPDSALTCWPYMKWSTI